MSARSMDVFSLRDTVVREYEQFATSLTRISANSIQEKARQIDAKDRYWPEPLIQIKPHHRAGATVEAVAAEGALHGLPAAVAGGRGVTSFKALYPCLVGPSCSRARSRPAWSNSSANGLGACP